MGKVFRFVIILFIGLTIAVAVYAISNWDFRDYAEIQDVDCVPPMSEWEQQCLDAGRCRCATY